jgi:hypothetical protein
VDDGRAETLVSTVADEQAGDWLPPTPGR